MDHIYSYMKHRAFPPELRRKVGRYFKKYFEMKAALNEDVILNELEPELREEVGLFLCHHAVSSNALFVNLPKNSLMKLGSVLKPIVVEQSDDVVTAGEHSEMLYILLKGEVAVLADDAAHTVIEILSPGSSFGELAVLGITSQRTSTIRAVETSELYSLSHNDLRSVFRENPRVVDEMRTLVLSKLCERKVKRISEKYETEAGSIAKSGNRGFKLTMKPHAHVENVDDVLENLRVQGERGSGSASSAVNEINNTIHKLTVVNSFKRSTTVSQATISGRLKRSMSVLHIPENGQVSIPLPSRPNKANAKQIGYAELQKRRTLVQQKSVLRSLSSEAASTPVSASFDETRATQAALTSNSLDSAQLREYIDGRFERLEKKMDRIMTSLEMHR
jgi:CRP-like cAMP-binding protein